jgi:hypothetical protein
MNPGIWDSVAGATLSLILLVVLLFGSWRARRYCFLVFCIVALSAFGWHAGCWYHQFACPRMTPISALAQG